MSDSTGETESTAGAATDPTMAEDAESGGSDLAVDKNTDTSSVEGGDASGVDTTRLPDMSDIEGATTASMTVGDRDAKADVASDAPKPAPTGEIVLDADTRPETGTVETNWAAPKADAIKESVDSDSKAAEDVVAAPPPPPTAADAVAPATSGPAVTGKLTAEELATATPASASDTESQDADSAEKTVVTPPPPPTEIIPVPPANATVQIPTAPDSPESLTPSVAMLNAASTSVDNPKRTDGKVPDPTSDIAVEPPKKKRHPLRNLALVALVLIAVFIGAWLFDSIRTSDQVLRNTMLGTTSIGGLTGADLDSVIDDMNGELADTPVTVSVGETVIETDPVTLGAELDRETVKQEALDAGRGGNLFMRPFNWVASFTSERTIDPAYAIEEGRNADDIPPVITEALEVPVEPELALRGSTLAVVPGSAGETIDGAQLQELLPAELSGDAPYAIEIEPVATQPDYTDDQIQAVVDDASEATIDSVIFRVLDKTAEVDSGELRSWIRLETADDEADWIIDQEVSSDYLKPQFPSLGAEDQIASFSVVDGEPIIIPASETVICCDDSSIAAIRDGLLEPLPAPLTNDDDESEDDEEEVEPALRVIGLEPEIVGSDEGVAELESLGIIEEVSTFETRHACCANRVVNIQRFADLMRGVIIRPGEDFSLNGHVGRRTIENGFTADGAIANGILEPQVGGGISQFATTFFNASFYAGIEFNEYQSHSLYISRYPRGREATISFPRPDLSVKNTTPYGILVWTSYTPRSITVTFYSTKHVEVEALDLQRSSQGACTRYTTPRRRTYLDGEVEEDSVFAVYRPGEGLDCNGNSTRPEDDPAGPTLPQPDPAAPAEVSAPQP